MNDIGGLYPEVGAFVAIGITCPGGPLFGIDAYA